MFLYFRKMISTKKRIETAIQAKLFISFKKRLYARRTQQKWAPKVANKFSITIQCVFSKK